MAAKRIEVYDTSTGRKLEHPVPANWLEIFPVLAPLPSKAPAERTSPAEVARRSSSGGGSGRGRARSGSRSSRSSLAGNDETDGTENSGGES